MKKLTILSFSTFTLAVALLTSCGGGVSTKPSLKSENDSIAYSFGAQLYETGLNQFVAQLGVTTDTMMYRSQLQREIAMEADSLKKMALQKAVQTKIDSVVTANKRNAAEFLRGLTEGLKSTEAQGNYLNGLMVGRQITERMLPGLEEQLFGENSKDKLNKDFIASAIAVNLTNAKPAIPNASSFLEGKMNKAREAANAEVKAEQDAIAKKFFEENAKKEGVVTLPSGLQYKIIKAGNGPIATAQDQVEAHYHGTLLDGTVFDSSVQRGEPATFGVTQVIKGWTEALQLMPEGSKWELYIPQDLAYGERGQGAIKPYSPLVFEVEVIKVIKAK